MRGFSARINSLLANGYNFQYCFQITDTQGKCHNFVQGDMGVYVDGVYFDAACNMALKSVEANDCAEDKAIIELVASKQYKELLDIICDLKIDILLYFNHNNHLELYKSFYVSERKDDGAKIELHLDSLAKHLHQRMLQTYSKTCRADLGDKRCKVPPERYTISTNLIAIEDSWLSFDIDDLTLLPLVGGIVNITSLGFTFQILSVRVNQVLIDSAKTIEVARLQGSLPIAVSLVAVCDKKLATCVQHYDNAVNFRGEPFIPGFEQFKL